MNGGNYHRAERLLTIENLTVKHENQTILRNVTGKIDNVIREGFSQGQVVALLGPSGMGKTQLFRCIAGLQHATSGGVFLNGTHTPVEAGEVGVVQQSYPLFKHRTILANLEIAAARKIANPKEARDKCRDLLAKFDLAGKETAYPAQLSGGQRQRVAIAQQLLGAGHFLLMDEPFSGLDLLAKRRVCTMLNTVAQEHELNTIIITTHDIESALVIADTLWLLGRERDDKGAVIPGAGIRYEFDLIEAGLAWQPDIQHLPEFAAMKAEIERKFELL